MTKEQFELAKAIEEELIHIAVAVRSVVDLPEPTWDGVNVNLSAVCLKYKADTLKVLHERMAELEAELVTL